MTNNCGTVIRRISFLSTNDKQWLSAAVHRGSAGSKSAMAGLTFLGSVNKGRAHTFAP